MNYSINHNQANEYIFLISVYNLSPSYIYTFKYIIHTHSVICHIKSYMMEYD